VVQLGLVVPGVGGDSRGEGRGEGEDVAEEHCCGLLWLLWWVLVERSDMKMETQRGGGWYNSLIRVF
jgi:hypothetical protein